MSTGSALCCLSGGHSHKTLQSSERYLGLPPGTGVPAEHCRPSSHLLALQVVAPPRMEQMQHLRALQAAQKQKRRQKRKEDAAQR